MNRAFPRNLSGLFLGDLGVEYTTVPLGVNFTAKCFPQAELCDALPKHFYFTSLFLFMLLLLDKFKKLIMCHIKLMARTINILYNFTNTASILFRFCDTLPAYFVSRCIKKNTTENFFSLTRKHVSVV